MGKRSRRRSLKNHGLNGNEAGFRFFTVSKILSYTDKPVLIIVPPHVGEECKEIPTFDSGDPMEKILFKMSVIKGIRGFFLQRAMDLHTPQTVADCCQDVMLAFQTSILGANEISEVAANEGGFDSVMSINCGIADLGNPDEMSLVCQRRT